MCNRAFNRGPVAAPPIERLLKYVRVSEGCWEWTGYTHKGYGQFTAVSTPPKVVRAYRYLYEALLGPVPEGLTLDHLCGNKACVRPDHLEPVAHQENCRRAWIGAPIKGRGMPRHRKVLLGLVPE